MHDLLHPLAGGIVKVVGFHRWFSASRLHAKCPHLITVVPGEVPFSVLPDEVAIQIEEVRL